MPRHTINKVTKQPVRVSSRKSKENDHRFPVERTLQDQPQATTNDNMSPIMAQQMAAMIQQGITEAFARFPPNPATAIPSTSTTPTVEGGQKRPAPDSPGQCRSTPNIRRVSRSDSSTPEFRVKQLQAQLQKDVILSLASSSQESYKAIWSGFKKFMSSTLNKATYSATPNDVALFVVSLHNRRIRSTTIRTHLSAIAFYFKNKGYASPTTSFHIEKLLVAYAKTDPPPAVRNPITLNILKDLLVSLNFVIHNQEERCLLKALFTVMYYGLLRISEVTTTKKNSHNLKRSQLSITRDNHHTVLLITFTTFKFSKPGSLKVSLNTTKQVTCPVASYQRYIARNTKIPDKSPHKTPAFAFASGALLLLLMFLAHSRHCSPTQAINLLTSTTIVSVLAAQRTWQNQDLQTGRSAWREGGPPQHLTNT